MFTQNIQQQARQEAMNRYIESKFTYEATLLKIQQSNSKSESDLILQSTMLLRARENLIFCRNKVIQLGGVING